MTNRSPRNRGRSNKNSRRNNTIPRVLLGLSALGLAGVGIKAYRTFRPRTKVSIKGSGKFSNRTTAGNLQDPNRLTKIKALKSKKVVSRREALKQRKLLSTLRIRARRYYNSKKALDQNPQRKSNRSNFNSARRSLENTRAKIRNIKFSFSVNRLIGF